MRLKRFKRQSCIRDDFCLKRNFIEKNMYPILDTRVKCKFEKLVLKRQALEGLIEAY